MKSQYITDYKLIQSYLKNNLKTQKLLYDETKRLIAGLIKRLESRGTTFYDRDNVVAEVLYQIMVADNKKVLRNYNGQSRLTTYLWPVIRNKIIDVIRKERSHYNHHRYQEEAIQINMETSGSRGNLGVDIAEYIAHESPLKQFIKISKWIENLSYQEIINKALKTFPDGKSLTHQQIAYILHSNRKHLQKKFKKSNVSNRHIGK
ncbi:sigma-70 family RNA polymerase sigma factor [bacterium]|nr:sigma-70 family RNA polymerase sigma factor [bacterium]RQV97974.1 MAG: sigma-70 family RNA polymerase sigma factor [bacterium]